MKQIHRLWALGYAAALTTFTGYLALDTFVLSKPEQTDAGRMNLAMFAEETAETAPAAETTFSDGSRISLHSAESAASSDTTAASTAAQTDSTAAESTAGSSETAAQSSSAAAQQTQGSSQQTQSTTRQTQSSTAQQTTTSQTTTETTTAAPVYPIISDHSYQDENISVQLSYYTVSDTQVYVADVTLSSAQYFKSAFANDTYGKNVTAATSAIAAAHNAVFAVNGDFYGARETGCVIRNGVVYRETAGTDDLFCLYTDGHAEIVNSASTTAESLAASGVWQAYDFGPALLVNGQVAVTEGQEVGRAMASNPRTAVGVISPLHYVFVVSDGRTSESDGLSLSELAQFMQSLGVQTAYNLDGGGSSTMYFNGQVINNPTASGRSIKERSVSDIVYLG